MDRDRSRRRRSSRSRSRDRRSPRRDSRERSRQRARDRSRDRRDSRERSRERTRDRSRDRRRSPDDRRRRSPDDRWRRSQDARPRSPKAHTNGADAKPAAKAPPVMVEEVSVDLAAGLTEEEIAMMRAMGMPVDFESTAGKHVDDESANAGAVKTETKRSARQYMNRKKGFNKPLPAEQTGQRVRRD